MNYKMIFSTIGKVVLIEAGLLALPLVVSLIYSEWTVALSFAVTALIALAIYALIKLFIKPESSVIFSKEGLIIVALTWIVASLIGCLPFVLSGDIPDFVDALFETVSGFTTTGASILPDVEKMSKGCMFWRCFTHWVGGMGIIVFVIAITSKSTDRSLHILRAEMPGPTVDKLVPRAKDTAKILYIIYMVMTAVLVILLVCGGMSLYESLIHAFGTAGTGGFGIKNDSLASYNNYCQWVIAIFMIIFGVNFNLYYLILLKKAKYALKSEELWVYLAIIFVSVAVITGNLIYSIEGTAIGEAIRHSTFQVASIISTSGFSTTSFNDWPTLSKTVLFMLMFIGGCAGSTAGGFKVSRVVLIGKSINRDLKRVLHPRNTSVIKVDGKRVDEATVNGVVSYFSIYVVCMVVLFLLISFENFSILTNLSTVITCFNNVGPSFYQAGELVNGSLSVYTPFSKLVLTVAMLLGRLEVYPLLLTLLPSTWIKK